MSSQWQREKQGLWEAVQRMAQQGLVAGTSGNGSMRLGKELLAITPSSRPYSLLRPEEIVVVDFQAEPVEGDLVPSSETLMHIAAYRCRPDAMAVLHTHSPYITVAAVLGRPIPPLIDELVIRVGGEVPVAQYAFPGTPELAEAAASHLKERNAVILRNHGLLALGSSLEEALEACQLVERAAQVFFLASLLGTPEPLPPQVVELEQNLYHMRRKAQML